ncbi:MAG: rhomboid family intramembrane serine protease [Candidatus Moraniibacteriota bacterium]|jgi:membrane associated rhomboid family serine protease
MGKINIFYKSYITYILIIINVVVFLYFYIFVLSSPDTINTFDCIKGVAPECIEKKEISKEYIDCILYANGNNLNVESCYYDINNCYKYDNVIETCGSMKTKAFNAVGFSTKNTNVLKTFYTSVTSMFIHKSWWHLLGNMLFLLLVGAYVESRVTVSRYLFIYFISGILAVFFAQTLFESVDKLVIGIGASGAIFGLFGANLVIAFRKRKDNEIAMLFGKIPTVGLSIGFLAIFFYFQLVEIMVSGNDGFGALVHIIGFIIGFVIALYLVISDQVD